jgi:hypothetical protein
VHTQTDAHALRLDTPSGLLGLGCSTREYRIISFHPRRRSDCSPLVLLPPLLCSPYITSSPFSIPSQLLFLFHQLTSSPTLFSPFLPLPPGTQMERVDLTIDDSRDRYKLSGAYTSSYEVEVLKKKKCIEIQR